MNIVPLYAAVLGLLYVFLSVRTLRLRRRLKIALGDGGNSDMLRAIRVHSNFAEYVPLTLVLLFFLENRGAPVWFLQSLCAAFLVGRMSHAYGVSRSPEKFVYRVGGMATTFTVITLCCLGLLFQLI